MKCDTAEGSERGNVGSEDGERAPLSQKVGSLKKQKKAKEQIYPRSLQKGRQPCRHTDFSPVRPGWASNLRS